MQGAWAQSLGWEDPLEKRIATHTSILAQRISWTEEPGKLQFMGSQKLDGLATFTFPLCHYCIFSGDYCSESMPSFNWDICVFIWRHRNSFCILNINFFSNMWLENIFPLCMWTFHSVDDFLCYIEAFSLHHFHLSTFAFVALLWVQYSRNYCPHPCHTISPHVSFQ